MMSVVSIRKEDSSATPAPTDPDYVEIGVDTTTNNLFSKDSDGNVVPYGHISDEAIEDIMAGILRGGNAVTVTHDDTGNTITIAVPDVTTASRGAMTAADKMRLNGLGNESLFYIGDGEFNNFGSMKLEDTDGNTVQQSSAANTITRIKMNESGSLIPVSNPLSAAHSFKATLDQVQAHGLMLFSLSTATMLFRVSSSSYASGVYTINLSYLFSFGSWNGDQDWFITVRPKRALVSIADILGIVGNSKYLGTNASGTAGIYDLPEALTQLQKDKLENLKLGVFPPGHTISRTLVSYSTDAIGEVLVTTDTDGNPFVALDHDDDYYLLSVVSVGDLFSIRRGTAVLTGKITGIQIIPNDPDVLEVDYTEITDQSIGTLGFGAATMDFSRENPDNPETRISSLSFSAVNSTGGNATKGKPIKIEASTPNRSIKSLENNDLLEGIVFKDSASNAPAEILIDGFVKGLMDHIWDTSNRLSHTETAGTKLYYKASNARITTDSSSAVECGSIIKSEFILPQTHYWDTALLSNSATVSTAAQANATRGKTIVVPTANSAITRTLSLPNLSLNQGYSNAFITGDRIAFVNRKNSNVNFVININDGTSFKDIDGNSITSYSLPDSDSHRAIVVEVGTSPREFKIVAEDRDIVSNNIYFSMTKYLLNK